MLSADGMTDGGFYYPESRNGLCKIRREKGGYYDISGYF